MALPKGKRRGGEGGEVSGGWLGVKLVKLLRVEVTRVSFVFAFLHRQKKRSRIGWGAR